MNQRTHRHYIEQDLLDQAAEALKAGKRLEDIAGRIGACPNVLAQLLPLPLLRPIPEPDLEICLFAPERMQAVL